MMRDNERVVGELPRAVEGSLVSPPIDLTRIQRYFGDLKGFGAIDKQVSIVTGRAQMDAVPTVDDPERALH